MTILRSFSCAILTLILTFIFCQQAVADAQVQKDADGNVRVVESSDISTWTAVTPDEQQAYEHPGELVPTDPCQTKYKHDGFWHLTEMRVCEQAVVYESDNQILQLKEHKSEVVSGRLLAVYKIYLLIAVGAMMLSNTLMRLRKRYGNSTLAASASAFAVVVTAFAAVTAFAVTAFAVVVALASVVVDADTKAYWIASAVFYILAVVALFV